MKNVNFLIATALMGSMAAIGSAAAQTTETQPETQMETDARPTASTAAGADADLAVSAEIIALPEWDYGSLYADGWSVEELIEEAEAYGVEGEEIGDIENILVGEDGQILAVVLEMGGFLDLGDTHIMVPWDQVEVAPDLERITVPVDQENAEEFSMYGGTSLITKAETQDRQVVFEEIATTSRVWQITELLNDFAVLNDGVGYGYVDDVVFDRSGQLQAVVVSADSAYGPGTYAYPYYGFGYGFQPGAPYYELGYDEAETASLEPFDRDQLDD